MLKYYLTWFFGRLIAPVLLLGSCFPQVAGANERIALVVTNQNYPVEVGRLARTHLDGHLVASALEKVGFHVTVTRDADKGAMKRAIADYIARLSNAGPDAVGFFYYSGHGANQSKDGDNYLIPTDAQLTDGAQLPFLGIKLGDVIEGIGATQSKSNFVVIDACRNVPFTRASKSATKGFAPERKRSGVMIAYATDAGDTAVDENVYAQALAAEIPKAGRPAVLMFRAVRRAVLKATNNQQFPWTRDGLIDDFYFNSSTTRSFVPSAGSTLEAQAESNTPSNNGAQFRNDRSRNTSIHANAEQTVKNSLHTEKDDWVAAITPTQTPGIIAMTKKLQRELSRVDCAPGPADGHWGPQGRRALHRFNRVFGTNLKERTPTLQAIRTVADAPTAGCVTEDRKPTSLIARKVRKTTPSRQNRQQPDNVAKNNGTRTVRPITLRNR